MVGTVDLDLDPSLHAGGDVGQNPSGSNFLQKITSIRSS